MWRCFSPIFRMGGVALGFAAVMAFSLLGGVDESMKVVSALLIFLAVWMVSRDK